MVLTSLRQTRGDDMLHGLLVADVRDDLAALCFQLDLFRNLLASDSPPILLPDGLLPIPRHLVGTGAHEGD